MPYRPDAASQGPKPNARAPRERRKRGHPPCKNAQPESVPCSTVSVTPAACALDKATASIQIGSRT
jgi:hypothetical protein